MKFIIPIILLALFAGCTTTVPVATMYLKINLHVKIKVLKLCNHLALQC